MKTIIAGTLVPIPIYHGHGHISDKQALAMLIVLVSINIFIYIYISVKYFFEKTNIYYEKPPFLKYIFWEDFSWINTSLLLLWLFIGAFVWAVEVVSKLL